jgi:hypothetical protein
MQRKSAQKNVVKSYYDAIDFKEFEKHIRLWIRKANYQFLNLC